MSGENTNYALINLHYKHYSCIQTIYKSDSSSRNLYFRCHEIKAEVLCCYINALQKEES